MATITTKHEGSRGCGYRKKGGKYFVSDGISKACGRLPIPLTVCPCCNQGIKQSRGFTWLSGKILIVGACSIVKASSVKNPCYGCPLNVIEKIDKFGLMWVGAKYYPSTSDFNKEASLQGISKRISQIPKDFVLGETWIALGHPEAIVKAKDGGELETQPGIFQMFKPSRIEYVVTGRETEEELDAMEARGFTLVDVIPDKKVSAEEFDEDE